MALDKQIHIFSVDTSAFYHPEEKRIAKRLSRLRKIRTDFRDKYPNDFYKELGKLVTDKTDFNRIKRASYTAIKNSQVILLNDYSAIWHDIVQIKKQIKLHKKLNKKITETKEKLINAFAQAVEYNKTHEEKRVRELNPAMLKNWNIISVFESSLTRVIGAKTDEVSDDIMIVRVYFFDILQDLILNGYNCNGEHYVYFSSSAGQIRTKKAVFIKESTFKQYEGTLMCGLTVDKINELGGMNINKYLAYLALDNSASDLYEGFDIDRTIVVEDFETNVTGEVDFIDDKTYDIERKVMEVPVPHTDGCGMIRTSDKNFTIRLPWIKGLLASWDFIDFINEHNGSYTVKDIYGDEHNLLEENIEIIFTKSQFKTWKFYKNWDEYKKLYKENNCQAGICCMEEDKIPYSTINYQMLQTLTDITEPEINGMVKKSNDRIHNLTNTIDEMLRVLGVDERTNETNSSPYSLALKLYPEMLADSYSKEIIKAYKKSMLKRYKAGKLEINGKYTFLLPDLYAVSQKLFLGMDNPEGILQDGEVYCSLFRQGEVDVLRSPHLYKEHAIRNNVKGDIQKRWFKTNAIYTSCHDLISKILQFDVDGDRALVVSDKNFCNIAKRNMNGIVPLYYNMQKAKAVEITPQAIYDGLVTAFVGGNIGCYSNDISKIWNSGEITDEAIRCVKWLCMENNFTIDYAKTLYKPQRPAYVQEQIQKYTKRKLPHYFIYAKDKKEHQTESPTNSFVDTISTKIKNKQLFFRTHNLAKFDYKKLMHNPNIEVDNEIVDLYNELKNKYVRWAKYIDDGDRNGNHAYMSKIIRATFKKFQYDEQDMVDMLVAYAYSGESKKKEMLWGVFGHVLYENLKHNIDPTENVCKECGKRFIPTSGNNTTYCYECRNKSANHTRRFCIDCGQSFYCYRGSTQQRRCSECQKIYRRKVIAENNRNTRLKKKQIAENCIHP